MPIGLEGSQNVVSTLPSPTPPLDWRRSKMDASGAALLKVTLLQMKSDREGLCIHQYSDFKY